MVSFFTTINILVIFTTINNEKRQPEKVPPLTPWPSTPTLKNTNNGRRFAISYALNQNVMRHTVCKTQLQKGENTKHKGGVVSWLPLRPWLGSPGKYKLQSCKICKTKNINIKKYVCTKCQNFQSTKRRANELATYAPMACLI